MLTQAKHRCFKSLRTHWEIWASSILVVIIALALSWFIWKISQLFDQKILQSFEATSLIVQSILPLLTGVPVLAAVLIAVASLRTQQKVQRDARRAIVDVKIISTLKQGASQYECIVPVNISNIGPGPAMDVRLEAWVSGVSSVPRSIGVLGPQDSTNNSITAEVPLARETFGQNVQLIVTYIDLFNDVWKSDRIYSAFPGGEGPLAIQKQCEQGGTGKKKRDPLS